MDMVETIYQFLITIIGDIPINETITLMKLVSYVVTFLITAIIISPIILLMKNAFNNKKRRCN